MLKVLGIAAFASLLAGCVWCSSGCDYYQPDSLQTKKTIEVGKGFCWGGGRCSDETANVRYGGWAPSVAAALQSQGAFHVAAAGESADYTVQIYDMTLYKFEDACNMILPLTLGLMPCMSTTEYNLKIEIADNKSGKVRMVDFQPKERWFGHILLMPFAIVDYHTRQNAEDKTSAMAQHIANIIYEEIEDK